MLRTTLFHECLDLIVPSQGRNNRSKVSKLSVSFMLFGWVTHENTPWYDEETPIDETMRALDDLVRAGKVRYVGCSNYPAWRLTRALWISDKHNLARYDSVQPHYNLVHRAEFERELKPLCEAEQIGVIPYSPLAGGFLTGKYQSDAPPPDSARLGGVKKYFNNTGWRVLHAVEKIAARQGATPLQVALAWQLAQPVITSPIIGANSVEQLQESIYATDVNLGADDVEALNEASAWTEPL